jgi:hypothetical protein
MTSPVRTSPLCLRGRAYVLEACPTITSQNSLLMDDLINRFLTGVLDQGAAAQLSESLIGTKRPIDKLTVILTVTDDPLQHPTMPIPSTAVRRKKSEVWTDSEDIRLLAGIHRFGLCAWGSIARFVGNNRTKAQCCQRWCRGLDPRISKTPWTVSEDEKLRDLVRKYGQKQWTRIAKEFGNRCDVQCRYRFIQLQKAHFSAAPWTESVQKAKTKLPPIENLIARAESNTSEPAEPSPNDVGPPCVIDCPPRWSSSCQVGERR